MLSYKLCKKLKDVGFPQIPQRSFHYEKDKNGKEIDDSVTIPILEDLIDACGDKFEDLVRMSDIQNKKKVVWWQAYMTEEAFDKTGIACVRDCDGYETGDTPLEAMTRLYIELKNYEL